MLTFSEYAEKKNFHKKLIDQYGKYKVFLVDGEAVRNSSPAAEEFGGSSTYCFIPSLIPKDEIWIEDDIKPEEQKILIASALYQVKHTERGENSKKVYERGLAKEKDYRDSLKLSGKHPERTDERAKAKIYVRKYGHIKNENIDVWLVDGEQVRNLYKTDFIEGAQPWVYGWTPNHEIWVELSSHKNEFPYIILHEYTEMMLMKYKKMKYDAAHKIAAKVEFSMRPDKMSKQDILNITKDNVLAMAKKFM